MKLRKIIPALFIFVFLFAVSASAKTLQLTIGDQFITLQDHIGIESVKIDAAPFISNSRTLVPVRVIAESFGSKVEWDDPTDTVTITSGSKKIKLVIGSTTASVNGKQVTLDVPANIYNDRTFVPIRFVTESLGYNVSYVDMTKDVIITDLPSIMSVNGNKVGMETYNLIKYLDEYDFTDKHSKELVEYSKSVYDRIESAYKKYSYVLAQGETLSAEKKKEIEDKLFAAYEDEDVLNNIVYGVYVSWEEKLAYAEIYDEKYAPEKQAPSHDEALINTTYNDLYYSVDYIKIAKKSDENLAKIIATEKSVAEEGFDAVYEKCAADETFTTVKGLIIKKDDFAHTLFDVSIDLELNGVSESMILEDGYYIARKCALPAISEDIKAEIIKKLDTQAKEEMEETLNGDIKIIITSDDALDLAE